MEADDFSKLAAAATTVNEGGAVAASSVSTTADESSMLKAVMLSQAQITQGLLARAQATQELLETLKPSLKRRSSRGKKDAAFLDTDSAFFYWEEDTDTLAQQALEQSLRLSGVERTTWWLHHHQRAQGPRLRWC